MNSLAKQRVLVTGVNGQVGRALKQQLQGKCELITSTRTGEGADIALDLSDLEQLKNSIVELKPSIVINPAAYTQVDKAEEEPELAFAINGDAPGKIAEACKELDALLIHYSTDYVFNGKSTTPYKEDDPTDPINVYGASKLAGEQAIQAVDGKYLIFRTCWVYDAVSKNFPNAILAKAHTEKVLRVVDDQMGTPTSALFIAEITLKIIEFVLKEEDRCKAGNRIFHLRPEGQCTWFGFAEAVISGVQEKECLAVREILPLSSGELSTRAVRPSWSVLGNQKIKNSFKLSLKNWEYYAHGFFGQ